jgi:hypothetical protein
MHDIYISAVNVLGWVWPLESLTLISPELTSTIHDTLTAAAAFLAHPRWSPSAPPKDRFIRLEEEKHFEDLAMLLQAPTYWTRRWIVQELVLPRFVTLVFGTIHIPLAHVEFFFAALAERYPTYSQRHTLYGMPKPRWRGPASMTREMKDVKRKICELEVREYDFTKCMAARICAYRLKYQKFKRRRRGEIKLYEGLRYFHDFECSNPLDVVYSLGALVDPRERLVPDYGVEVVGLVMAVYKKLRRKVGSQRALLYAMYLIKRMEGDVEGVLERWFGDGSDGGGGGDRVVGKEKGAEPLEIDFVIRKRAVVVGHLESIDELDEGYIKGRISRDFESDGKRPYVPPPPLRPRLQSEEGRDTGLDGFSDPTAIDEMREVGGLDPAILGPLEIPRFPETQEKVGEIPSGSIPIQDEISPAGLDLGVCEEALQPFLFDDYPHDDTQSAMPSIKYHSLNFEAQMKRDFIMQDLENDVLCDAFWDQPTRGPKFWERRLKRHPLGGYYTLIPGPATPKMRDDTWEADLSHRFFTANTSRSILGRYSIYGVSEFPLSRGDEIWQIPGVEMAFVMRKDGRDEYRVVSRAYVCPTFNAVIADGKKRWCTPLYLARLKRDEVTGFSPTWDCLKCGTVLGEKRVVKLDLPFLLELCR